MEERIKYLESKIPNDELEEKYWSSFEKEATYLGNGIYSWRGIYSKDTRELFLIGVLTAEKIRFKE